MLQTCSQPYLDSSHSFFMISSQWGILLQLYGIYLIINNSFDSIEIIGGLCVAVGMLVFVLGLVSVVKIVRSKLNVKSHDVGVEDDMDPKL